jgi:hypothetical protein
MDNHNDKSIVKKRMRNLSYEKENSKHTFEQPNSINKRSATNLIYCAIADAFIPTSEHGKASVRNSISILTASRRISSTRSTLGL